MTTKMTKLMEMKVMLLMTANVKMKTIIAMVKEMPTTMTMKMTMAEKMAITMVIMLVMRMSIKICNYE